LEDAVNVYAHLATIQVNDASGGPAGGQPFEKVAKQLLSFGNPLSRWLTLPSEVVTFLNTCLN